MLFTVALWQVSSMGDKIHLSIAIQMNQKKCLHLMQKEFRGFVPSLSLSFTSLT